ncbi:MAG: cellulase family glycosylhydrolase [Herpetosiphonaceae bacterium]|nr:cellulase family glycosylhydrolase [Herpetosiphonaceae bacterium]
MGRGRRLSVLVVVILFASLPIHSQARSASADVASTRTPFGVVGNLAISVRTDEQAAVVKLMQEAGVQWSREEISWERLQKTRDQDFAWVGDSGGFNNYDSAIDKQAAAGINMLGLLDYNPAWYKGQNGTVDDWINDWYTFVFATVSRYGQQRNEVFTWEVWNEPNLRMYGYENGLYTINDYIKVLRTAQQAIRAADPRARIVLGGVTAVWSDPPSYNYDILTYLHMLGDAGGWDTFDILAIHPYRPGAPEDTFWRRDRFVDFDDELADIDTLLDHYGHKPIWFTEIGWSAYSGYEGHSEQEQAMLVTRLYVLSLAHPEVEKIFWYNFRNTAVAFSDYPDAANDPHHPEYNFGLLRRTYPLDTRQPDLRKPAFSAYRAMTDLLGTLQFETTVADGKRPDLKRIYWYRWSRGDNHVEALWRMPDATVTTVSMDCGCDEVHIRAWDGHLLRVIQTGNGQLSLNLPTAGEPMFVQYGTVEAANPAGLFFAETSHGLSGRFLRYWQAHGSLAQFGYPITGILSEPDPSTGIARQVQYFERNRFEYFPENDGTAYEVQLGLLGDNLLLKHGVDWHTLPVHADTPPGCRRFSETQHLLCPPFRAYWETHGGLALYGLPISDASTENGLLVQYFERNRFEEHPEYSGTPSEVLLGLLGRELYSTWGIGP